MIEADTIIGTVESNDGDTAAVRFSDGAVKLFSRGPESKEEFRKIFLVGSSQESRRLAINLSNREGLFDGIKPVFPTETLKYRVGLFKEVEGCGLVTLSVTVGDSGITVFCAPVCESPDGSDGQYSALAQAEQLEWLDLSQENFEYVCGEIAAASPRRIGVEKKRSQCKITSGGSIEPAGAIPPSVRHVPSKRLNVEGEGLRVR